MSKKKRELLLAEDAEELIESYNGLAETAYIARLAQRIICLYYGWKMQTLDSERRVFTSNGRETAKIRSIYKMNDLLLSADERIKLKPEEQVKKNRKNPKHHALDAYCISYSQNLKPIERMASGDWRWEVEGFNREKFEQKFKMLFPDNPRRNKKELYPQETMYGYKSRLENGKTVHYLTVHKNLFELLSKDRKKIKDIWDEDIRNDLEALSEEIKDIATWKEKLENYKHPKRHASVKRVLVIETTGSLSSDHMGRRMLGEFKDFGNGATSGQFKHSKQHQGQIIYFDDKNRPKVQPVYAHQSLKILQKTLRDKNFKLYNDGMLFYSGSTLFIPKPFGQENQQHPAGPYKLRTIIYTGSAKVENANGEEILTNIKYLVEAGFALKSYHSKISN